MIEWLDKRVKRMDAWDVGLVKFAVAAGVLFVITMWSAAMDWVHSVNPWYFLVAMIVFAARPWYKVYLK
jgi:hypothetical protein